MAHEVQGRFVGHVNIRYWDRTAGGAKHCWTYEVAQNGDMCLLNLDIKYMSNLTYGTVLLKLS